MTEKEELDIYGPFEETDVQKIQRQELEVRLFDHDWRARSMTFCEFLELEEDGQ